MHETPHGHFHLDSPSRPPPAGRITLQGWAAGRPGRPFADLRVRIAGETHPAVYGFPRADLAAFFKLNTPFLPGGFEATLSLPAGSSELAFEALDVSGTWQPLQTVTFICEEPPLPPTAEETGAAPVMQPHEFARALLGCLRTVATLSVASAATRLARALPQPAVIRYPHLPFHGHLHQPTLMERVLFGRLRIEGWLFHETLPIRRVAASVDLQTWQDLARGGEKPYVAAMFPQFDQAKSCRIDGLIDVPAQLPDPLCVRIYAELDDGTWHLCHAQRVHTWDQEQEKIPLVAFSSVTFGRTALALHRDVRSRGFIVPHHRAFWRGLRGACHEYRMRARPCSPSSVADGAGVTPAVRDRPLRQLTLFTHNLALEGAPLFLLELARHLAASGTRLQVISAADGPLAQAYRQLGASVQIVDVAQVQAAATTGELQRALVALTRAVDFKSSDLVIANTLSTWWGVHLAHRARRPSLFYIHESTTPAMFYLGHMAPATLPRIEATFRLATYVSFLTETTRRYYRPWLGPSNHGINPGWIDVTAIDRGLSQRSRPEARHELSVSAATRLIVNVGSICDRKGQHIFARGVDLLWRQDPALAATCRFLMIGGRDTLFDRDLQSLLDRLARPNLEIIPATAAPLIYYQAADLFACSSYEESLPRVIMEAMACRVPILSSAVHGIRDLLPDTSHGWLIPPGDTLAVCAGLHHLLSHPDEAARMTENARARVTTNYAASLLLPRHAALAASLVSSST